MQEEKEYKIGRKEGEADKLGKKRNISEKWRNDEQKRDDRKEKLKGGRRTHRTKATE